MSLQLLAKQMEAKGRGGDSVLVHMTPGEVAGLQKLAESAGGSLSVNPETGLVEANFLKRMLPTLVGLGLGMTGVGLPLAMGAGALVGGYQAKRNDQDVGLGAVLGGLGAMGGANLASGLASAGSSAATNAATAGANTATAIPTTGLEGAIPPTGLEGGIASTGVPGAVTSTPTTQVFGDGSSMQFFDDGSSLVTDASGITSSTPATDLVSGAGQPSFYTYGDGSTQIMTQPGGFDVAGQPIQPTFSATPGTDVVEPATATSRLAQTGRGIENMGTKAGREAFAEKFGTKSAMAAAAPLLAPEKLEKPEEIPVDDEMYYTEYTPGQTGERSSTSTEARQFAGRFSPVEKIKASEYADRVRRRSIYSAAEGGEVADAGIAGGMAGNTGATANAMSYLMGQSPSSTGAATPGATTPGMPSASQAGLQYLMGQAPQSSMGQPQAQRTEFVMPTRAESVTSTLDGYREIMEGPYQGLYEEVGGKLVFDPTAQKFHRAGNVFRYTPPPPVEAAPAYYGDSGGGGGDYGGYGGYGGDGLGGLSSEATAAAQAAAGFSDTGGYSDSPASTGDTGHSGADSDGAGGDWAKGGLLGLAKGGMRSGGFVIPADVVSMIGEGNTDAGYKRIKSMVPGASAIKGKDGGQADTVKTHIEGKQPARVAHGEMYVPPETVKRMGGAKKLYAMMDRVRQQATGSKKQIRPVSLKKALA